MKMFQIDINKRFEWLPLWRPGFDFRPGNVSPEISSLEWRWPWPYVQRWAKWRLSIFDLYPRGEGHGVQGQMCDILRPQLAMNRFLPLWPHRFPHFGYIHLRRGGGGALILDRCRAFDLFASVNAHLWLCHYDRLLSCSSKFAWHTRCITGPVIPLHNLFWNTQ